MEPASLRTRRLVLRRRDEDAHRDAFAQMNSDPAVTMDLGGPLSRADSDRKFDRYCAIDREYGFARWAVETAYGEFLGYAGVMPAGWPEHPLGSHYEVGWRFRRCAWGNGYATESAHAAMLHARRQNIGEILSYTAADNLRSRAVMERLGLERDPARGFCVVLDGREWCGLVWATTAAWSVGPGMAQGSMRMPD